MPNVIPTVVTPISRQYLGARYVPVFDGAWDNTKDYAPLTVVSYEGNSYTSRTYVPSGTSITDETYWALSGNYNAQVESYRQEVAALVDEVDTLDDNVNTYIQKNDLITKGVISFEQKTVTAKGQDSAVYNGNLFTFDASGHYDVKDFESGTTIGTFTLSGDYVPHANAVCFGRKENESDAFPLLYVTAYNGTHSGVALPRGVCCVYKINSDYTNELKQVITIDFTNTDLWGRVDSRTYGAYNYGDFIVDTDNNQLYVITNIVDNRFCDRVFRFAVPSLSSASVTLTTDNLIDYYDIPYTPVLQGCTYHDGLIYIANGANTESYISVLDIVRKQIIANYSVLDVVTEIESVVVYEGSIYVAEASFYKISAIPAYTISGDLNQLITNKRQNLVEAINEAATRKSANFLKLTTGTSTDRGITFDIDEDTGLVHIHGTYNSTATSVYVVSLGSVSLPKGHYILSGNPASNLSFNMKLQANAGSGINYMDTGHGHEFVLDDTTTVSFAIYCLAVDVGTVDYTIAPSCQLIY